MNRTLRQSLGIVLLATFLSLIYNALSAGHLPLLRSPAKTAAVSDSLLFAEPFPDTLKEVRVIAPLHDRALARQDSIRKGGGKQEPVYTVISLDQLKKLLGQKRGLLIDARNEDEFLKGHIKGARNIPALEVDKHFEELVMIPRDTLLLIYCSNPECPLGRTLARFVLDMEFTKVYLYDEGWNGWEKAGMPPDTSRSQ